jgi:hypothetical protein
VATAGAIRAGRAFIELFVDRKKLSEGLRAAGTQVTAWGKSVTASGRSMMLLGAGITAPLLAASKVFATVGDDLAKLSDRTGIAVEELSTLKYAVGQSGGTMAEFETAIKNMQKTLAKTGEFSGVSPDEQFRLIAESISQIQDPSQRAAKAIEYFGRSGTRLLPMMLSGAKGIKELQDEARKLGLQMSTKDAKAAVVFGDAWSKVKSVLTGVLVRVGAALAPALTKIADVLAKVGSKIAEVVDKNRGLITAMAAVGAAITLAGGALVTLGTIAIVAGAALKAMAVAVAVITSPIGIAVAAVAALSAALYKLGAFDGIIAALGERFGATFSGIAKAIGDGDITTAFKIVAAELKLIWGGVTNSLKDAWGDLTTALKSAFMNASAYLTKAWTKLIGAKKKLWEEFLAFISGGDTAEAGKKTQAETNAAVKAIDDKNKAGQKALKDERTAESERLKAELEELTYERDRLLRVAQIGGFDPNHRPSSLDRLSSVGESLQVANGTAAGTFNGARAGQILGSQRTLQDILNASKEQITILDEIKNKKPGVVMGF